MAPTERGCVAEDYGHRPDPGVTPVIRPLDPVTGRAAVDDLFRRSADYVRLERGQQPTPALTDEFFTDTVPGGNLAEALKLGLLTGPLLQGIADTGFGFPEPGDAFLGLMQFATDARGQGLGAAFLRDIEDRARGRGAPRLYIAVLHANPRGRAFWERQGFTLALADRPVTLGLRSHIADRMVKPLT
jgi:GNAT superfamily N-acetyltransferase